jgi:hypothetical protein
MDWEGTNMVQPNGQQDGFEQLRQDIQDKILQFVAVEIRAWKEYADELFKDHLATLKILKEVIAAAKQRSVQKTEAIKMLQKATEHWAEAQAKLNRMSRRGKRPNAERDAEIVRLHDEQKLSWAQIARKLEMKVTAVRQAYDRAKN